MYRPLRFLVLAVGLVLFFVRAGAEQPTADVQMKNLIDQVEKKASLKFDPTTPQAAIDTSEYGLRRLSEPSIVVSISQAGAIALAARQIDKDGSKFSDLRLTFSDQAVGAKIGYSGSLLTPVIGAVDVRADLNARMSPAIDLDAERSVSEFRVRLAVTSLEVTSLNLSQNGQPLSGFANGLVETLASGLLVPAQKILSQLEFRIPTMIATKIDLRASKKDGVTVDFTPKSLTPSLQIVALSYLIDRGRLTILAQDAGLPVNDASSPHNVSFETLREDFSKKLSGIGANWIEQGELGAYIEAGIVDRLASKMLSAGPVCMQAKVVDLRVPVHQKLSLPPESSIDCTPSRDCTPTKDCSQNEDCAQRAECGEVCTLRAPITGHCITHGHDLGCETGKVTRKLACEADKKRRSEQCEAEKVANKGSCELLKTGEKGSCEGLKQAYKSLRGTGPDYADVDSDDLRLGGDARACLKEIKFDGKALHMTGRLAVDGSARADGKITFTPLNVIGHAMCFAPFSYQMADTATVAPQNIGIDTSARLEDETGAISLGMEIPDQIHIRFPFRSIVEKLATDPKFQVICPIPGVATQFRVLTPDAWWPAVARGELDRDFPKFALRLDLFSKPIDVGGVAMTGRLERSSKGVGGFFDLAGTGNPH